MGLLAKQNQTSKVLLKNDYLITLTRVLLPKKVLGGPAERRERVKEGAASKDLCVVKFSNSFI